MNTEILDIIKELSLKDTKTLSQKGLKLADEVGTLANRILSYENADGHRHKVAHKHQVLEESIDAILVSLSIAYSLGYDDAAIASMMEDKAIKWSGLKELDKSDGRYPFEIHLTVDHHGDESHFINIITDLGMKAIILDLDGETQVTTSSVIYGSTTEAIEKAQQDAVTVGYWYPVDRVKIETVPWHPMVPRISAKNGCYFESHFTFIEDDDKMADVKRLCKHLDVHISRNKLRHTVDGMNKFMGTIRHNNKIIHDNMFNHALKQLEAEHIKPVKTITEYAFYDTNQELDNKWLKL